MKKILIISSGIHNKHGSGITLKNLFKTIPKDNVCIITNKKNAIFSYENGYNNIFILNLDKTINEVKGDDKLTNLRIQKRNRNTYVSIKNHFKKFKHFLIDHGYYYKLSNHKLTNKLKSWLTDQSPTSIYSVGIYIPTTIKIQKYMQIPIVLHIMDDWISTEIKPGPISFYWKYKLNRRLLNLINRSNEHLAVSKKMANEYQDRYEVSWMVFHNPLRLEDWLPYQKQTYDIKGSFKIAFFGRKTSANSQIIDKLARIFTENSDKELKLEFHIYSQVKGENTEVVSYHDFISHNKLPETMVQYDLLILPFFFDKYWTKYVRLSMPTKFSEYLISGVPVFLLSSKETALYEFCDKYECAFIANKLETNELKNRLKEIIHNKTKRRLLAEKGKKLAKEKFDSQIVSKNFIKLFE